MAVAEAERSLVDRANFTTVVKDCPRALQLGECVHLAHSTKVQATCKVHSISTE